jgi:hypothetical protein
MTTEKGDLMISEKFKVSIKLSPKPAYLIAQEAGIDPSVLSKIICGIITIKPYDLRVIEVGKVLGIPADECFKEGRNTNERMD